MDAERGLIARILFKHEIQPVIDRKVLKDMFVDVEARAAYSFVLDFYAKYGSLPSIDLVEKEFPDLGLMYAKEPIDFYIDRVIETYVRNKGSEILTSNARLLMTKPDEGLERIRTELAQLTIEANPTQDTNFVESAQARLDRYLYLKNLKGIDGIPTPWDIVNEATMGFHDEEFIAIVSRPGVGKAQPLDSIVITETGPRMMGTLRIGDKVFGKDGALHEVTGIYPQGLQDCYRVEFTDGSVTECCLEHLWTVKQVGTNEFVTMTLGELLDKGLYKEGQAQWEIPIAEAVQYPVKDLELDPYVLGCMLADGSLRGTIKFLNGEQDVVDKFKSRLPEDVGITSNADGTEHSVRGMYKYLEDLGLRNKYAHEKFIPEVYATAHVQARLELLHGLFDCDGEVTSYGSLLYHTTSDQLAKDVQSLVESLGGTASISIMEPMHWYGGELRKGRASYTVSIQMPVGKKCFSSKRHEDRLAGQTVELPQRRIVSVEKIGRKEMQCITVDAVDQLYLTDHYVVTHNTFLLVILAEFFWQNGLRVLFVSNEMPEQQIARRIDAVHFKLPYKQFRAGLLPDPLEQKYIEGIKRMKDNTDLWIVSDTHGITSIATKIDQYKPDIVLIDGLYLLQDDRGARTSWERVSNISRDTKRLARQKQIPIVATTQFNRAVDDIRPEKVTLSNIGFSDSLGQDADVVIGLFKTKDMELNNEMMFRFLKLREGEPVDFVIMWDLQRMEFKTLDVSEDELYIDEELDF